MTPAITGLIVNGEKSGEAALQPSTAYFELYRKHPLEGLNWWLDEIRKSREFDWTPYVRDDPLPTLVEMIKSIEPKQSPNASDLDVPAQRGQSTTYRIIRDSALARLVKMRHNYVCQICGEWIDLPSGERYAEAHHVQPLGTPHNGPDRIENIVCVCPNHHAELDYFARLLDMSKRRSVEGHSVDEKYVHYHNEKARDIRKA